MKYGVVIVTYNRLELLKVCIEHVMKQSVNYDEVIIINNCSTDGTGEYLEQLLNVHICNLPHNIGGAGGFSAGVREAEKIGCDWVTLIDDDAMLDKDYLYNLIMWQSSHKNVKAMCGSVYTNNKIALSYARRFYISKETHQAHVWNVPKCEYLNDVFYCDMASFCGITFCLDLLDKVGYPDDRYFISFDDTEYTMRLRRYTQIALVTNAIIDHRTKGGGGRWKLYYNVRNELYTIRKHFGWRYAFEFTKQKITQMNQFVRDNDVTKGKKEMIRSGIIDAWLGVMGKHKRFCP